MADPVAVGISETLRGLRRSPLADAGVTLAALPESVRVIERAFLAQLNLRVSPAGAAADAVAKVLGVALPTTPCTAVTSGTYEVLWMGPDEWLVLAPDGAGEDLAAAFVGAIDAASIGAELVGAELVGAELVGAELVGAESIGRESIRTAAHGAVTDVSAQRFAVSLSGRSAREVLAKGCSIDLHPSRAPSGTCVQTLLAQTGVVIVVQDASAPVFLLLVRSSFAQYFVDWLSDATVELS